MTVARGVGGAARALLRLARLCLPIVVLSWRFFDEIAPAPRIDVGWSDGPDADVTHWQPLRPTPGALPWPVRVAHLFANARRNETLYLVSCADKVCYGDSAHAVAEIRARVRAACARGELAPAGTWLRYRICTVERDGDALVEHEAFRDHAFPVAGIDARRADAATAA